MEILAFRLNKKLDNETFIFLCDFTSTPRLARYVDISYGIDGEFYVTGDDRGVKSHTVSPRTQPSHFCPWRPSAIDDMKIQILRYIPVSEKTTPEPWIKYLISKILAPRGYVLNGVVTLPDDTTIRIVDNVVNGKRLIVDYSINKLLGNPPQETLPNSKNISLPNNKVQKGISKATGKKTKHQIAKEKHEAKVLSLNTRIVELETLSKKLLVQVVELQEKNDELELELIHKTKTKEKNVRDIVLDQFKTKLEVKGSLDDFKVLLKNLLKE